MSDETIDTTTKEGFTKFSDNFFGLPDLEIPELPSNVVEDDTTETDEGKGQQDASKKEEPTSTTSTTEQATKAPTLKELLTKRYADLQVEGDDDDAVIQALEKRLTPNLHPVAARVNQALAEGKTPQQVLEQLTAADRMLALKDEELISNVYKAQYGKSEARPHGLDDEAIAAHVKRLAEGGSLSFEAIKIRDQILAEKKKQEEAFQPQKPVDWNDPATKGQFVSTVLEPSITKLASDKTNIPGIDWAKPEHVSAVKAELASYLTPDQKLSGLSPFAKDVQDNFAAVALVWKMYKEGAFAAHVQKSKEAVKGSLLEKLGMVPPSQQQHTDAGNADAATVLAAFGKPSA